MYVLLSTYIPAVYTLCRAANNAALKEQALSLRLSFSLLLIISFRRFALYDFTVLLYS